ncbi:hypothetical protein HQ545_06130 [Candidatus Woesearchaeota archaeon]|nr:hypothetical protein [Candidatus Woesearchaeota archaeon]
MPAGEQTIAGKPFRIIRDISENIDEILPLFNEYNCIVVISKYNSGKSSSATNRIFSHFGESNTEYITLTRQDKNNEDKYRNPTFCFGDMLENKIIIFDELHCDEDLLSELMNNYITHLIERNKVIILSNLYGNSNDVESEITLFAEVEKEIIPNNTLFVFVTND